MEMGALIVGVVGISLLVIVGLVIAMGVVVYKDANAHGMRGGAWAAIVILLPNLIGLIIYLVVRSNQEKKYQCSNCQTEVQRDYNVCPNCQAVFGESCSACKHAVSSEMSYCPYCGEKVEIDTSTPTAYKVSKKTNIVKPLAIIGSIFIAIIIIIISVVVSFFYIDSEMYRGKKNLSIMSLENNVGNTRKERFKYKDGYGKINLTKEAKDTITIDAQISLTQGNIQLILLDPNGKDIYSHIYEGEVMPETVEVPAEIKGKYTLEILVNEASGSYEIKAN